MAAILSLQHYQDTFLAKLYSIQRLFGNFMNTDYQKYVSTDFLGYYTSLVAFVQCEIPFVTQPIYI